MRKRLELRGGITQQDRMIKDKLETLYRAVHYSYQGAKVQKEGDEKEWLALMNPDKLKLDYDDKTISIEFASGFEPGDVFEWKNTGTYWLIYLQDLTELAYFRGDCRKCKYEISWLIDGEKKSTRVAVRGPVETKLETAQKHGISMDTPNYSLHLYVPKNEDTVKQFKRYSKFFLKAEKDEEPICWRIEAVDAFSSPGILEINAVEYYANEDKDDIENGVVNGLVEEIQNPNNEVIETIIEGETFIQPKIEYTYSYKGQGEPNWEYDSRLPLKVSKSGMSITIKWLSNYSGQFDLKCGEFTKTIVVDSLF